MERTLPRVEIKFDDYKVKAFLDTNIILECRALGDLPWDEIDSEGPIIALLTPTAMREVDSKKQDGRIGKRARAFNRLIAPVATGGGPIIIRNSGPRVELALSHAVPILWDKHDDLDPTDSDSRIIAELLYAADMSGCGKLMVSQDIRPIALATAQGVGAFHVSESWLYPRGASPMDSENQKLRSKLQAFEATQPTFDISIELGGGEPFSVLRIEDLTDDESKSIGNRIHELNPPKRQSRGAYGILEGIGHYDLTYDDRFEDYKKRVSTFMSSYSQRVERLFNQTTFTVRIVSSGAVHAENLLVDVRVSSGWLHDRYALVSPQGPAAPSLRQLPYIPTPYLKDLIRPRVGRHEYEFREKPCCEPSFSVTCEDFRQGQTWDFNGVVGFDPGAREVPTITVTVTASNFRGASDLSRSIVTDRQTFHVYEVIDLHSLQPIMPIPMRELMTNRDLEKLDFAAFSGGNID